MCNTIHLKNLVNTSFVRIQSIQGHGKIEEYAAVTFGGMFIRTEPREIKKVQIKYKKSR